MLLDYFTICINDDSILQKLLTESNPNLAKVMEIATACMQTAESLRVISNKSKVIKQDPSVNKVTFGYKQKCFSKPPNSPPPPDISESTRKVEVTCWRCGGNHQAFQCWYRNYTCDNWSKRGHLKCRHSRSKSKNFSPAYHIGANSDAADIRSQSTACSRESSEELYEAFFVGTKSSDAPIIVDVTIDKVPVRMEVDTGASRSIMSESKFTSLHRPSEKGSCTPAHIYWLDNIHQGGGSCSWLSLQNCRIWKQHSHPTTTDSVWRRTNPLRPRLVPNNQT